MTGGITIDLSQFEPVLKKFATLSQDLQDEFDAEFQESAREFVGFAKNKAPGDTGRLRGSINFASLGGKMNYEAFAQTTYAAYQEWGTIEHVSVPPDLVDVAINYMTKNRKRFKGGVKPKQYFFSNRGEVTLRLLERLDNIIGQTLSK